MKRPKNYTKGPAPIYLRITMEGKRSEFATGRKCEPERWNSKTGRAVGTRDDIRSLNSNLTQFAQQVEDAYQQLRLSGELITVEMIKDKVQGKNRDRSRMLLEVFADHNRRVAALVGKEYSPATLQRYETTLKHVKDMIVHTYRTGDIQIGKVNYSFIMDLEYYLLSERSCANNSAVKYIKNFKKIIRICLASGWLDVDPFLNYKAKLKPVERDFLSAEELTRIVNKKLSSERLGAVRDIFVFSCYTGLAYADVQKLSREEVARGNDGEMWIRTCRKKTDTPANIPLMPLAVSLIEKYRDHPVCASGDKVFPVSSNQKMNAYLKEIADLCGIEKELTYHIARHTFATTVTLSNGVPIESVSKMLGHTNIRTTQHYAKILDMKVGLDMKKLREKFAGS